MCVCAEVRVNFLFDNQGVALISNIMLVLFSMTMRRIRSMQTIPCLLLRPSCTTLCLSLLFSCCPVCLFLTPPSVKVSCPSFFLPTPMDISAQKTDAWTSVSRETRFYLAEIRVLWPHSCGKPRLL